MENKTTHRRSLTEQRINLIALIAWQMRDTARAFIGEPLTEQEKDCIGFMAEDIAFKLPEDTRFGKLHALNIDEIMEHIIMLQKQEQQEALKKEFVAHWGKDRLHITGTPRAAWVNILLFATWSGVIFYLLTKIVGV